MKLGCDGDNPCKTCRHKKIECKFSRLESKGLAVKREGSCHVIFVWSRKWILIWIAPSIKPGTETPSSERGSIKFLLNSGTASFVECFRLPSTNERRHLFTFRTAQKNADVSNALDMFTNSSENGSTFSDPFDDEPIDWTLFEDENLLRFLSSPFSEVQMQTDDMFNTMLMDPTFASAPAITSVSFQRGWEPPTPYSSAAVQAIFSIALSLQLSPLEQGNISQHLNYLFTPSNITKLANLYFEFWHPHCPIIHQQSFNVESTPTPLLVAVVMVGAMYSQNDTDVSTAKLLLDLAELYIFSMDDLTDEYEIRQMLRAPASSTAESIPLSMLAFQHLQAAYQMVCVQFWAGNMVSRKRTIDTKFGAVVKVFYTQSCLWTLFWQTAGGEKAWAHQSETWVRW